MRKGWWLVGLAGMLLMSAAPAHADSRFFTYTYDWFTPAKDEKEVELTWTQTNGGKAEGLAEFEYGITSRYLVAPYLVLERQHDGDFKVNGWQLEQRYRFGNFGRNRFLPAVYLEVAKRNGEPYELEGKFITSYLFGDAWIWSSNLILEQDIERHNPLEFAYSQGVSHPITKRWDLGAEAFGNFRDKTHFFGPGVRYRFDNQTRLLATFGARVAGPDDGAVRVLFEKEWR